MSPLYKDYIDLLEDDNFLLWRMMPTEESNSYWSRLQKENPLLQEEIERADKYLKDYIANRQELTTDEREELLKQVIQTVHQHRFKPKRRSIMWLQIASVSAIILLVIGIFLFQERASYAPSEEQIVGNWLNAEDVQLITGNDVSSFEEDIEMQIGTGEVTVNTLSKKTEKITIKNSKPIKLIVPYGKRSQITLSDGSKVWLNSGSTLEFPSTFVDNNRTITLTGEMYIEVFPHEKPFIVNTTAFDVRVYGTKFNVTAYENSIEQSVALIEGSVSLQVAGKSDVLLHPEDLAIRKDGVFTTEKVNVEEYISWKDGYLFLDRTPVMEVLRKIERYYNISFNYEKDVHLQKRTCSGKIHLSDDLDDVMKAITLLSSTKYTRDNKKIIIYNVKN